LISAHLLTTFPARRPVRADILKLWTCLEAVERHHGLWACDTLWKVNTSPAGLKTGFPREKEICSRGKGVLRCFRRLLGGFGGRRCGRSRSGRVASREFGENFRQTCGAVDLGRLTAVLKEALVCWIRQCDVGGPLRGIDLGRESGDCPVPVCRMVFWSPSRRVLRGREL
jgi:hypothetical protein